MAACSWSPCSQQCYAHSTWADLDARLLLYLAHDTFLEGLAELEEALHHTMHMHM